MGRTAKPKILNVRTTENEYAAIETFAAFQGLSATEFVVQSVFEKIEEWEDIEAVREYEMDKAEGQVESISWEQVRMEAGLL